MLLLRLVFFQTICFTFTQGLLAQTDPFKGLSANAVLPISNLPREKFDTSVVVDLTDIEALFLMQEENAAHILEVSPLMLNALQLDTAYNKQLYILDLRGTKAHQISHIKDAKPIEVNTFSVEDVWALNRKGIVILYSLQGEDVDAIGANLRTLGFECIYKLQGNYLEWMNAGFPIHDEKQAPTDKIFLPNKQLAKLLKRGKAIY